MSIKLIGISVMEEDEDETKAKSDNEDEVCIFTLFRLMSFFDDVLFSDYYSWCYPVQVSSDSLPGNSDNIFSGNGGR